MRTTSSSTSDEDKTALDLEALKELVDAATPGPWLSTWVHQPATHWSLVRPIGDDRAESIVKAHLNDWTPSPDDGEFIAAARTAIPALIAEVERLRAQRDEALAKAKHGLYGVGLKSIDAERTKYQKALRDVERVLSRTEDGTP